MGYSIDETGNRYGRWLVIKWSGNNHLTRGAMWLCRCDCGTQREVLGTELRAGNTKSCGCLQKEMMGDRFRLPKGQSASNLLYHSYKRMAKKRNHVFLLAREDFEKIISESCYYCGEILSNEYLPSKNTNGSVKYNGIDRVDNKVGYVQSNIVSCCKRCNMMKGDQIIGDFIERCKRITTKHSLERKVK